MNAPTDPPETTSPAPKGTAARQKAQADVGANLEAERLARIEARDNPGGHPSLAAALVAFQSEMPVVPKNSTANIPGKEGRTGYSYSYADLPDVSAAATPVLTRHGLAFVALPGFENGNPVLRAQLIHALGETITAGLPLHGRTAQEIGSSLTYGRRYLLGCMTGVVTDEDNDGSLAVALARSAEPPWHGPTSLELLDIISQHAITAGTDLEQITAKWRQDHGGVTVEQMGGAPPPLLAELEASISKYLRENPPTGDPA